MVALFKSIAPGSSRPLPPEFQDYLATHDTIVRNNGTFYSTLGGITQLKAMMFVVCNDGAIFHIYTDCENETARVLLCEDMRAQFVEWGVSHYCWTGEAWCASGDTSRPVAERADRVEVVYVNAVNNDGQVKSSVFELVRDWTTGLVAEVRLRPDLQINIETSEFSRLFG